MHYVNAMHVDEAAKLCRELLNVRAREEYLREALAEELRAMNVEDGIAKKRVGITIRSAIEADDTFPRDALQRLPLSDWSVRLTLDAKD